MEPLHNSRSRTLDYHERGNYVIAKRRERLLLTNALCIAKLFARFSDTNFFTFCAMFT